MFREIRGVQQPRRPGLKRWFQDSYFDLHLLEDGEGDVEWFQLCYARDTARERVLEWKRRRGFLHMKVEQASFAGDRNAGSLALDGVMPYREVVDHFATAAGGLPPAIAAFVVAKVREYARPSRRFRRPGARTPRWLERLRRVQSTTATT
jgi:hypothetical protein